MHRKIFIVSIIVILISLIGCSFENNKQLNEMSNEINKKEIDNNTFESDVMSPPKMPIFYYNSFDEVAMDLNGDMDKEQLELIEEAEIKKGTFKKFLKNRVTKNELYIPCYNKEMIPLSNEEGFSNIKIFPSEAYDRPWIWYYGEINNSEFTVKTAYLTQDEYDTVKGKSIIDFLREYQPGYINSKNFNDYPYWENVYESELILKDRTVDTMVYQLYDDPRITVGFMYDEILVKVTYYPDKVTDDIWKALDFKKKKIK